MPNAELLVGDILRVMNEGVRFRLIDLLPSVDQFVVIRMPELPGLEDQSKASVSGESHIPAARPPLPVFWSIPETQAKMDKGLIAVDRDTTPALSPHELTDAHKKYRDRALQVIQMLAFRVPEIYIPESRSQLIKEATMTLNLTRQTIFSYLRQYWYVGRDISKLTPNFHRCGAPGKPRQSQVKLGRPRTKKIEQGWGVGVNVTQKDIQNIRQSLQLARGPGKTLRHCYKYMLLRFYWQDRLTPDGVKSICYSRHMTFEQFRFHAAKFETEESKARARLQPHTFRRQTRAQHKGSRQAGFEVGAAFQIDGTHLNIPAVMTNQRDQYIGGLIVVHVSEVVTGMIVGFWLGLESEIYEVVMMALVSTVRNKVDLCRQFGIEIEDWEWGAHHFCQTLVADRGSAFFKQISDCITKITGPNPLANTPSYMADLKGGIEAINGAVKKSLAEWVQSAYSGKGLRAERGSPDPRLKAFLTVDDVKRAYVRAILHHNLSIKENFPTFPELVSDGVPSSPQQIWDWALKNHRHRLTARTPESLELLLMPRKSAKISTKGVYIGDELFYAPEERQPWYRQMELKEKSVDVAINRQCVDYIFMFHPEEHGRVVRCAQLPKSAQFRGMSLSEVQSLRRQRRENDKLHEVVALNAELRHMHQQKNDEQRAMREKELIRDPEQTKVGMIGDVRDNRAIEKSHQRINLSEHLAELGHEAPASKQEPANGTDFSYPDFE
jgi:hypothetical protein